jgi:ribosomal protein S18 acetylase RimI-like enzyme
MYAVRSAYRHRGVGEALARHSLETAKAKKFKAIQFNAVVSTNVASLRLWEKLGFSKVGEVPSAFKSKADNYVSIFVLHKEL